MGRNGERGLMQVTEAAASDWARQNKRPGFVATDLFNPEINVEAGTWYLRKALQRYAGKDDPVTFALAEYNAGKSRVDKWMGNTAQGSQCQRRRPAGFHLFPQHPELRGDDRGPLPLLPAPGEAIASAGQGGGITPPSGRRKTARAKSTRQTSRNRPKRSFGDAGRDSRHACEAEQPGD